MEEYNNGGLVQSHGVVTNAADVPVLADDHIIAIAETAERRVEAMSRIKRAALKVTNANDWTNQGGKPYLQVSGSEKIARLFGISWRIDEPVLYDEGEGHYSYTYKGYFRLGGAEIEAIGSRSSKDPFFSKRSGSNVPPSEIDRNNVKKAAYTNLLGNGITRLLGIRNMTWEDLSGTGIESSNLSKVEYDKPEMSNEAKSQRDSIRTMILEMAGGSKSKAQDILEGFTSFPAKDGTMVKGKRLVDRLSEKAVPVIYGKVKTAYEKWQRENKPQDNASDKDNKRSAKGKEPLSLPQYSEEDVPQDDYEGGYLGGANDTGQQTIE